MTSTPPLHGLLAMLASIALSSCAHTPPENSGPSYVLIRHAEKSVDDPRDPSLSAAGHARAHKLAASFAEASIAAVYATAYRRTQQTAAPTASAHALAVTTYDASQSAGAFARQLQRAHTRGTVLVVGHGNTVPELASALCSCVVEPMSEAEYDRRLEVEVDARGNARLTVSRY